mmetsp:Transcript_11012/g.26117  ORF Transcript_11012/g.26117 Transcript_11012/m.26117 type:complete len:340 (-) Transcript_11012:413-1432(-)
MQAAFSPPVPGLSTILQPESENRDLFSGEHPGDRFLEHLAVAAVPSELSCIPRSNILPQYFCGCDETVAQGIRRLSADTASAVNNPLSQQSEQQGHTTYAEVFQGTTLVGDTASPLDCSDEACNNPSSSSAELEVTPVESADNTSLDGQESFSQQISQLERRIAASFSTGGRCVLLGPVSCSELRCLSHLLSKNAVLAPWLYVAVEDRGGRGFRDKATSSLICLADSLSTNTKLTGLILRMPSEALGKNQLQSILLAFGTALQQNVGLKELLFKPSGYFAAKGVSLDDLKKAARLSRRQTLVVLGGARRCSGPGCRLRWLPREVLQQILESCSCKISNA